MTPNVPSGTYRKFVSADNLNWIQQGGTHYLNTYEEMMRRGMTCPECPAPVVEPEYDRAIYMPYNEACDADCGTEFSREQAREPEEGCTQSTVFNDRRMRPQSAI